MVMRVFDGGGDLIGCTCAGWNMYENMFTTTTLLKVGSLYNLLVAYKTF